MEGYHQYIGECSELWRDTISTLEDVIFEGYHCVPHMVLMINLLKDLIPRLKSTCNSVFNRVFLGGEHLFSTVEAV